jgi:hypothetical protein
MLHPGQPRMGHAPALPAPRACLVLCLAALLPSQAAALQPLVTDDTETQGRGGNQLEVAYDRERVRARAQHSTLQALSAVYTRGLSDTLDGYVELSRARIRSDVPDESGNGAGNPALGFKWRLWDSEAQQLSVALKPELQLGTSRAAERRGLGAGRAGYAATLIVTREFDFGAVHWNVSGTRVRYQLAENRHDYRPYLYRVSVAPVVDVAAHWKLALDVGAITNPDRTRRARMGYAELAAIWSPRADLELALGVIALTGDGEPRTRTLSAGLTWRF